MYFNKKITLTLFLFLIFLSQFVSAYFHSDIPDLVVEYGNNRLFNHDMNNYASLSGRYIEAIVRPSSGFTCRVNGNPCPINSFHGGWSIHNKYGSSDIYYFYQNGILVFDMDITASNRFFIEYKGYFSGPNPYKKLIEWQIFSGEWNFVDYTSSYIGYDQPPMFANTLNVLHAGRTSATIESFYDLKSASPSEAFVQIRYREQGTSSWSYSSIFYPSSSTGFFSRTITGLSPQTTYEIQASGEFRWRPAFTSYTWFGGPVVGTFTTQDHNPPSISTSHQNNYEIGSTYAYPEATYNFNDWQRVQIRFVLDPPPVSGQNLIYSSWQTRTSGSWVDSYPSFTGLAPDTTYRVYAELRYDSNNIHGTNYNTVLKGGDRYFTTKKPASVETLDHTLMPNGVRLNGRLTLNGDDSAIVGFRYREVPGGSWQYHDFTSPRTTDGQFIRDLSYSSGAISQGKTYEYYARVNYVDAPNKKQFTIPVCGDGICSAGEFCAKDCLEVVEIVSYPSNIREGDYVDIDVRVRNNGDGFMHAFIETAIVPESWNGQLYSAQSMEEGSYMTMSLVFDDDGCCPENYFYDTKEVALFARESNIVTFTLKAPTQDSVDRCGGYGSAWDTSFNIVSGMYDACGDGYFSQVVESVQVSPESFCGDGICEAGETMYNCPSDCTISMNYCHIYPDSIRQGDVVDLICQFDNPSEKPVRFGFGGSLRDSNSVTYDDPNSDVAYTIGSGKTTLSRSFRKTSDLALGVYDVLFGVHTVDSNDNFVNYMSSETLTNALAIDSYSSCTFPDGSYGCTCPAVPCPNGYICSSGACVPKPCDMPDGTSYSCSCNSHEQCLAYGSYKCDFGPGPNACVSYAPNDQCSVIDAYQCVGNDVYRCEQSTLRKVLVLAEACSFNQVCPANVATTRQCETLGGYSIQIEHSSAGTVVNKQPFDILTVKVKTSFARPLSFSYDSDVFFPIDASECLDGYFPQGETSCTFSVGYDTGLHEFSLEEFSQLVRVIDNPYALYVTHVPQLFKRFGDNSRTELLLKKVYEKAEEYRGVVYDLSTTVASPHPFEDIPFISYSEPLLSNNNVLKRNDYVIEAGTVLNDLCSYCKEKIIIGDDYVVPSYLKNILEYQSYLFSQDSEYDHYVYTDISYAQRERLLFSDFEYAFKIEGVYSGKEVLFILPENYNENYDSELYPEYENMSLEYYINSLWNAFDEQGFLRNNQQLEIMYEYDDFYCLDNRRKNEFKDKTLIIIGTERNNPVLKCYPFVDNEYLIDSAHMERNLWSPDDHALIINTNDPAVVEAFAEIIRSGEFEKMRSHGAYMFRQSAEVLGWIAIGAGATAIAVTAVGTAPISGAAILTAGIILDKVSDTADISNACFINFDGYGSCALMAGMIILPSALNRPPVRRALSRVSDGAVSVVKRLRPFRDVIENTFRRLKKHFGTEVWSKLIKRNSDNVNMARGVKRIFGNNIDDLGDIARRIPSDPSLPIQTRRLHQGNTIKAAGVQDQFFDVAKRNSRYSNINTNRFSIEPDFSKKFDLGDNYFAVRNRADGGVIVYNKQTGNVLPSNSERSFNSMWNHDGKINDGARRNLLRESEMAEKLMNERGLDVVFFHNLEAGYPDIAVFDENGMIQHLANTGYDDWADIGGKIQTAVNDGFSFDSVVYFSRDKGAIEVTSVIEQTLNVIPGSRTIDSVDIMVGGRRSTIKFVAEGALR